LPTAREEKDGFARGATTGDVKDVAVFLAISLISEAGDTGQEKVIPIVRTAGKK
jgi:hypothetical protein